MSNHLTCASHSARSQVLPSGKIVHRSDGSECLSMTVVIGERNFTPKDVLEKRHQK